jgi:hypothetical protein
LSVKNETTWEKLLTTPLLLSMEVSIVVANKLIQHGIVFVTEEVIKECIVSAVTTLTRSTSEKYWQQS